MPFAQLKSKTGCLKCKARRKKCDEKRPLCTACARWNFACLWPTAPISPTPGKKLSPSKRGQRSRAVATRVPSAELMSGHRADESQHVELNVLEFPAFPCGPSWSREERQAFDFFRLQTSSDMTGVFRTDGEMEIWSRMLLQGAHQIPEIGHAICALGALHQHRLKLPYHERDQTYFLAAQQYNKAIRCTMRSTRVQPSSVDAVLVMCILFTLLERLLGDIKVAMSHLRIGMKLLTGSYLRSVDLGQSGQSSNESACIPRTTIVALLRRLERQLYELGQTRLEVDPLQAPSLRMEVPATFANLEEASMSFELYFSYANRLMHTCEWKQEQQRQAQKPVEADLVSYLHRILAKWTKAFTSFLQNSGLDWAQTSGAERWIIHTLQLHRLVLHMSLAHYQTGDEMVCDKFMPQFAEAVVHGAHIVRAQQQAPWPDNPEAYAHNFTHPVQEPDTLNEAGSAASDPVSVQHPPPGTTQQIDMNNPSASALTCSPFSPLPALFTIAWRCRDPIIRRRAIRLLQDIDWCDAFWDSKITAKLAERMVQIEENGYLTGEQRTPSVERAEQIPLAARCKQVRAQFEKPHVFVFDFFSIDANEWVPGSDYWQGPAPESFCQVGKIRETWYVSDYKGPQMSP